MTTSVGIGPLTGNFTGPLGGAGNTVVLFDSGQLSGDILDYALHFTTSISGYAGSAWNATLYAYNVLDALVSSGDIGVHHFDTTPTHDTFGPTLAGTTRLRVLGGAALNSPDTATITLNGSYVLGESIESVGAGVGALSTELAACCVDMSDKLDQILAAVRKTYTSF